MRTILDNCNDILRDIGEPDKVFVHVQDIKGILERPQEDCEICGLARMRGYKYCEECGKKLEAENG